MHSVWIIIIIINNFIIIIIIIIIAITDSYITVPNIFFVLIAWLFLAGTS